MANEPEIAFVVPVEEYDDLRVLPYPEDWADLNLFEFVRPGELAE